MNARPHVDATEHYPTFIHEAGHAVAELLLGMHVTHVFVDVDPGDAGILVVGESQSTGVNTPPLARLVGAVAGEVAERRWYVRDGRQEAATLAHSRAGVDLANAAKLTAYTTLPVAIGDPIADVLIGRHEAAVARVADALFHAPGHRLSGDDVLAAAGLADAEVAWPELCELARQVMPHDAGLELHLAVDHLSERHFWQFIDRLYAFRLLATPRGAPRRQLEAEIHRRTLTVLQQELSAHTAKEPQTPA